MPARVAEDFVPIGRLGAGSQIVRDVLETGRPAVVTQEGVGVAVIIDAQTYEAVRTDLAARALVRDLQQALQSADAGQLIAHDEVLRELRQRYAGLLPNCHPHLKRSTDSAIF
jgi:PHD/YefM family antitoxin component YafN of YafNO toxin-antitoxin module